MTPTDAPVANRVLHSRVLPLALLLTAVLRWALPEEQMGPLAIRGKVFDVLFCSGLGGLMLWLVLIE